MAKEMSKTAITENENTIWNSIKSMFSEVQGAFSSIAEELNRSDIEAESDDINSLYKGMSKEEVNALEEGSKNADEFAKTINLDNTKSKQGSMRGYSLGEKIIKDKESQDKTISKRKSKNLEDTENKKIKERDEN